MRIFAVSDLHTDFAENCRWLQQVSLTVYLHDVLVVAEVEAGRLAAWSEMTAAIILPQQFAGDFSANLRGRFTAIAPAN
jgi:hypothetical protein